MPDRFQAVISRIFVTRGDVDLVLFHRTYPSLLS